MLRNVNNKGNQPGRKKEEEKTTLGVYIFLIRNPMLSRLYVPPFGCYWLLNKETNKQTNKLCLPNGCRSGVPLPAPKQKAKEKGGKTRGNGENGSGDGSSPSGLRHPITPIMEPGWSMACDCLPHQEKIPPTTHCHTFWLWPGTMRNKNSSDEQRE